MEGRERSEMRERRGVGGKEGGREVGKEAETQGVK